MTSDTLISLVSGSVISVIITLYFALRFSQEKDISYVYSAVTLIDRVQEEIQDDIAILYKGSLIRELTEIRFALWNSGRREVVKEDICGGGWLTCRIPMSNILSVSAPVTNREAIQPHLSLEQPDLVRVSFRFLNRNDAICFSVNVDSSREDNGYFRSPELEGDIIGHHRPFSDLADKIEAKILTGARGVGIQLTWLSAVLGIVLSINLLLLAVISPTAFSSIMSGHLLAGEGVFASAIFMIVLGVQALLFGAIAFAVIKAGKVLSFAAEYCDTSNKMIRGQLSEPDPQLPL